MYIPASKWSTYLSLKDDSRLSKHLPETSLFTQENVECYLERYGQIIVKPCIGSFGRGVIIVSALEEERFEIHNLAKKTIVCGQKQVFDYLMETNDEGDYIVQQRIALATNEGSPFDLRVMVQRRSVSTAWKITGSFVKVAIKGFMITNASCGPRPVRKALADSTLPSNNMKKLLHEVDRISLLAAKQLEKKYPLQRMFGLDIGIDNNGRVWIIEVNLKPVVSPFRSLNDRLMLQRILLYRKGRMKKKNSRIRNKLNKK